ncbi:MAG: iron-containing redox enzyme family protein [Deltaproteobacteria bacterium]|nr:iron-containing redox enzyme family protein [Deltaproteobacteria bacterium]
MTEQEWSDQMVKLARAEIQSDVYKRYYGIKLTKACAQVYLAQLGLFIRHRRDCWANVSANCPELSVKQKILEHEYEEIIEDEYSKYGHLDLVVRQAKSIEVSSEEILNVRPLPTTMTALYAYGWLTRTRPWQEGLAVLMATERVQNNKLLEDLGGGHSLKTAKKWMEDLGLTWEQIPNTAAHSKADEKHSEMFLSVLAEFVPEHQEEKVLQGAKESLDLRELMYHGINEAMEKV